MRRSRSAPLVLLLVVAGLLVAADLIARVLVEEKLTDRLAEAVPTATARSAKIHSFPFLPRLLASGRVPEVDIRVDGVEVEGLRFDSITADLRGVQIDRRDLVDEGRVVLRDIDRGAVQAVVTEAALSELTGFPIQFGEGRASVTVLGQELGADLAVEDGRLLIGGVGVQIPGLALVAPLLPCVPDARIDPGELVLSCEFTGVPAELVA